MAICSDRQICYEVEVDSLPMTFCYSSWSQEALVFPTLVVGSMASFAVHNVSLRLFPSFLLEISVS